MQNSTECVKPKIDSIYIGGAGRSGSTLLSMILGQYQNVCAVGELTFFLERGIQQNQLCSCGSKFSDCEFWSEVHRLYLRKHHDFDLKALITSRNIVAGHRNLVYSSRHLRRNRDSYAMYNDHYEKLIQSIHEVSGRSIIVDSSKYFGDYFAVSESKIVDIHLCHLVRSCHGVVYSWKHRSKSRPEIWWKKEVMPRYGAVKTTLAWYLLNHRFYQYQQSDSTAYQINYEDLSKQIDDDFDSMQKRTKLDFGERDLFSSRTSHILSGNPSRFSKRPVDFQMDDEYLVEQNYFDRVMVTALLKSFSAIHGLKSRFSP